MHEQNPSEAPFVGRAAEQAAIASAVQLAAGGRAQVVWIEGEAGAGKTRLAREAVNRLPAEFTVLRAGADEFEMDASLAVLSQLGPLVATGPFPAGLELLERLSTLQNAGPVAVLVEDLHWADVVSRRALLTTARRLYHDRVVMVITTRPAASAADGWEHFTFDADRCLRVPLGGFDDADVATLARRAGVTLTTVQAARLRRHTAGHALHVRTLLSELTAEQLTAPGELPAPRSLAAATIAGLAELTPDARALAAALAVAGQQSPLAAVAKVARVPYPAPALEALLATRFVTWRPAMEQTPVEFSHPLYRAAVYDDLTPTKRRELHLAWAEVLRWGPAWAHRVAAADPTDDELADELDAGAEYEVRRDSLSLAATYLTWASPLTSARATAEARLLRAARLLLIDLQAARAEELLPRINDCAETALRDLVLGSLAYARGDAELAERWFRSAVALSETDPAGRWIGAAAHGQLGLLYALHGRGQEALDAGRTALALGTTEPEIEHSAWWALSAGEGMVHGPIAGLERLAQRLPPAVNDVGLEDTALLIARGMLATFAGRTDASIADLRAAIAHTRWGLSTTQLPRAHLNLSFALFQAGEWDDALVQARTARSLIVDEGRVWLRGQADARLAAVLACRGDFDGAAEALAAAVAAAQDLGTAESALMTRLGEAVYYRARGEPAGVIAALTPLLGRAAIRSTPALTMLNWSPTLITALIDHGDVDAAAAQIDDFAAATGAARLEMRSRLLDLRARLALARNELVEATALFDEAIALSGPDDPYLDRALLHHADGHLLRLRGNRRGARDRLRVAHEMFERVGAEPFLQRVAEDLTACGFQADPTSPRSPFTLTEREQDVVALVRRGMTNREVAAEIYVSAKAVEYHLGNVYAKLGISSRRELRDRVM